MKKTFALLTVSALALNAGASWAQATTATTVGNPDSANILMIEQTEAVIPAPLPNVAPAQQPDGSWATGNGAAVAPMPNQAQAPQVTPPAQQVPGATMPTVVEGSYGETVTPNSVTIDEGAAAY